MAQPGAGQHHHPVLLLHRVRLLDLQRLTRIAPVLLCAPLACSEPYCPWGTSVYDGQTDVPPDIALVLHDPSLPAEIPALREVVSLVHQPTGEALVLGFAIDRASGRVTLETDGPLADGDWVLAVDYSFPNIANGHWLPDNLRDPISVRFTVGPSRARYLGSWFDFTSAVPSQVLVFSEPIDLASLQIEVVDGDPVAPEGFVDGDPWLVRVPTDHFVEVRGATASDGEAVDLSPFEPGTYGVGPPAAHQGRAECW